MGKVIDINGDGLINKHKDGTIDTIHLAINERHGYLTDDNLLYVIDDDFLKFLHEEPKHDLQNYPDGEFMRRVVLYRM